MKREKESTCQQERQRIEEGEEEEEGRVER